MDAQSNLFAVVKSISGTVSVTSKNDTSFTPKVGDHLAATDVITTGADGLIEVELANGELVTISGSIDMALVDIATEQLGAGALPMQVAVTDEAVVPEAEAIDDEVAALQQAIAEGADPTELGEATAAGAGSGEDGGNSFVTVDFIGQSVTPTSGFDTVGINSVVEPPLEDPVFPTNTAPDAVDDPPVGAAADPLADDDGLTLDEDTSLTFSHSLLLSNDTDADGDPISIIGFTQPANGSLVDNGDGTFTYTPDGNYNGGDTFVYTISDGNGGTDSATVTLTINPLNDPPSAGNDSFTTAEDSGLSFTSADLLANDSDLDGDTLSVVDFTSTSNGTLVQNGNNFNYTPNENFNGDDTFTYTISDGNGGTDTATVTITVTPVNDPPVANDDPAAEDDSLTLDEDTSITFGNDFLLQNDFDIDGDPISVVGFTQTSNGVLVQNQNGSFTYTPDENYNGVDTFEYTITDGNGGTDTATVTLTINPINDPPVANNDPDAINDGFVTDEDTSLNIGQNLLLGNDTDADGDTLSITAFTQPANGTLVQNPNGSFTYTPDADFNGTDPFQYTITDGNGGFDTATVTLTVTPVNDAPVANDDSGTTDEDTSVNIDLTTNDTDIDGTINVASIVITSDPSNGSLVVNANGTVDYTPNTNYNGSDSFTYTVEDNDGLVSNEATVSLTINDVNDPPVAVNDSGTTDEDTALNIDLTSNDTDLDGTIDVTSIVIISDPSNGSLVVNADGTVDYTPDLNYNGSDSFTYTVQDDDGHVSNVATVNLTVDPINDPPVAVDDVGEVDEDATLTVSAENGVIQTNDFDIDGDTLTVTAIRTGDEGGGYGGQVGSPRAGTYGTLTIESDGSYVYVADQDLTDELPVGETVVDTFTYQISDGNGGTDSAQINITVTGVNDGPVAIDDESTTNEDQAVTFNITGNDSDIDGTIDVTSVVIVSDVSNGTLVNNFDGTVTYTPDANYNGEDSFTYTVNDNDGATSNVAEVNLDINPVNDPPVAINDSASTDEDNAITFNITDNDTDLDGTIDVTSVVIVSGPTNGTLVENNDGTVTYTPDTNYNGSDSFTYTVNDDGGATSNVATVNLTINDVNDPPVAVDDSSSTDEDTAITFNITDNDTDLDGTIDATSVSIVSGTSNGTLVNNGDGTVTYTPDTNYNGSDSFTYTVNDDDGATSNVATVNLTINDVNDPPVAVDDNSSTDEDNAITFNITDNDTDLDGTIDATSVVIVSDVSNGTLVNNGDGTVTYTPDANYNGSDSFTYTVQDDDGQVSNIATVSLTVNDVNDPPVAMDDSSSTDEDTAVTFNITDNDTDLDGTIDVTSVVIVSGPTNGSLVENNDGTVTYTPNTNYNGPDSFTYTVQDDDGQVSNIATVNLTVNDVNDPPVAIDDSANVSEDSSVTFSITGNDTDLDGTIDTTSVAIVGDVSNGTLVNNGDGTVTYTPDADYNGTDSFTYTVNDEDGATSNVATVTLNVNPTNDITFALTVTSGVVADDLDSQNAIIHEEDLTDNTATYTVTLGGDSLTSGSTASVVINLGDDLDAEPVAEDGVDYTLALYAAITAAIAALPAGHGISFDSGTGTLTFSEGGLTSLSFSVTAFDDTAVEGTEDILVNLSGETVSTGTAALVAGQETAHVDIQELDASISNARIITNSNVQPQSASLFIYEKDSPDDGTHIPIVFGEQGQAGSDTVTLDLGIDQTYIVALRLNGEGQEFVIVTDLLLQNELGGTVVEVIGSNSVNDSNIKIQQQNDDNQERPEGFFAEFAYNEDTGIFEAGSIVTFDTLPATDTLILDTYDNGISFDVDLADFQLVDNLATNDVNEAIFGDGVGEVNVINISGGDSNNIEEANTLTISVQDVLDLDEINSDTDPLYIFGSGGVTTLDDGMDTVNANGFSQVVDEFNQPMTTDLDGRTYNLYSDTSTGTVYLALETDLNINVA